MTRAGKGTAAATTTYSGSRCLCVRVCLCVGGETVIWGEYVPLPTCGKRRAPEDAASQAGFGVSLLHRVPDSEAPCSRVSYNNGGGG